MANLFNAISGLFSKKSEAEIALERANKVVADKQKAAKEYTENKAKLEKEIEAKRQQASEELAKQAQIEELMFKAAKAVSEAHQELELRRNEFHSTASEIANEAAEITKQVTQAKKTTEEKARNFQAWLDGFDDTKNRSLPKPTKSVEVIKEVEEKIAE